ncbi:MAG: S41 family peptidase [Candidatus Aminicenantes bacterium]|nr:S41 family peptidase [Candidatus Aminicenantes bacterium]
MKKQNLVLLLLAGLYISLLFYYGITNLRPAQAAERPFEPLLSVFRLIRSEYIEEKNPLETMDGALRGLVNSLDPFSGYLNQKATALYLEQQKESVLYDVGILVMKRYGFFPMIVGFIPDSQAQKQDIKVGDYITEINGESTSALSLTEIRLLLRSKQKSSLTLKTLRGEKTQIISLERERILANPYTFRSQPGTSGWLEIYGFFSPLTNDFIKKIIPRLGRSKEPFIIDLRAAQEGQLDEAIRFLNQFINGEKIIIYRGRNDETQVFGCPQNPSVPDLNLVVWVSSATQDLAELVAGVLQEKKKAPVIGYSTPGLVAKREFFLLRDGSSFFLTTAIGGIYPDKLLWNKGIEPNIKLNPDENNSSVYLQKTLQLQSLP